MPLALAIHGGAWNIPDALAAAQADSLRRVGSIAWAALCRGRAALDVVEEAVRALEDDPLFNAGRGAHLNAAGEVELDASIMEGTTLRAGAVGAVRHLRHPVTLARHVLERSPHVLLVGEGALQFARRCGMPLCRTASLLVGRERERYLRVRRGARNLVTREFHPRRAVPGDTVGAVALDRRRRLAAATSTGGTQHKAPGRVGDSAIVGAGTYADDGAGAVSCTGWGEAILRLALARRVVEKLEAGWDASRAARHAIRCLERVEGLGGVIVVDRSGGVASACNTPRMARALVSEGRPLRVCLAGARRR